MSLYDIFFYLATYFSLFYVGFYLLTFLENRRRFLKDPKPKKLPDITMIIPAYNEEKHIVKCIKAILNQNYPRDKIKTIVVDDGSTDRTGEIARSFKGVKVLRKKSGGYKAAAINFGLKHVKTEIVGYIDADTYMMKNAIRSMVGYFNNKKVGAVIGNVKVYKPINLLERLQSIEYLIYSLAKRVFHFIDANYVTPAFTLYRTSVIKKLGGFEMGNPTEDMEIALKIMNAGYIIRSSAKSNVYTEVPSSIKSLIRQRIRWNRGLIINSSKYKHMILNPKFGELGIFAMPTIYINIFIVYALFTILLINIYKGLWEQFIYFKTINFDLTDILRRSFTPAFYFDFKVLIFIAGIIIGGIYVFLSHKYVENRFRTRNVMDYAIFLLIWPLLVNAILTLSITFHLLGRKHKW